LQCFPRSAWSPPTLILRLLPEYPERVLHLLFRPAEESLYLFPERRELRIVPHVRIEQGQEPPDNLRHGDLERREYAELFRAIIHRFVLRRRFFLHPGFGQLRIGDGLILGSRNLLPIILHLVIRPFLKYLERQIGGAIEIHHLIESLSRLADPAIARILRLHRIEDVTYRTLPGGYLLLEQGKADSVEIEQIGGVLHPDKGIRHIPRGTPDGLQYTQRERSPLRSKSVRFRGSELGRRIGRVDLIHDIPQPLHRRGERSTFKATDSSRHRLYILHALQDHISRQPASDLILIQQYLRDLGTVLDKVV